MTDSMTAADLIRAGQQRLVRAGIESPRLDAEILLRDVLGISQTELYLRFQDPVSSIDAERYMVTIMQRTHGMPVAYLTGKREFYGRIFQVSPAVLVPRPETELLVQWCLEWLNGFTSTSARIVDVGTGSGAIALSIAAETDGKHLVVGSDVSLPAIEIARKNRQTLGAQFELVGGELLSWTAAKFDLIAANLPYLRPDQVHAGIEYEPEIALFAGEDGFALNRVLLEQASSRMSDSGTMIMELDPAQRSIAIATAQSCFPNATVSIIDDLAGTPRFLTIVLSKRQSGG